MSISQNLQILKEEIPQNVELVAVSKFHPVSMIREAYDTGQRLFGESRVQELLKKKGQLPDDIKWHFIGHLQTNKVRQLIGIPYMIESVDSVRLLELINKESEKIGITTNVLLQIHVAREETKFGFYPEELLEYFTTDSYLSLKSVRICGIMGMATNTDDEETIRKDFRKIHDVFSKIKSNERLHLPYFKCLSMGMSGDWRIGIEEGANIVRIGSAIFGERV